jgi:hypothetical protein
MRMRILACYAASAVLRQMRAEGRPLTAEALLALWRQAREEAGDVAISSRCSVDLDLKDDGQPVHAGELFVADGRSPCAEAKAITGEIADIDSAVVVEAMAVALSSDYSIEGDLKVAISSRACPGLDPGCSIDGRPGDA